MRSRVFYLLSSIFYLLSLFLVGCGMFSKVVTKQDWSENYTKLPGTKATSLEMIDGNYTTGGQSVFPEGAQQSYGATSFSEVVVQLPEKKSIFRVIVHSPNVKSFDLLSNEGMGWNIIKQVKATGAPGTEVTDVRVSTITDQIKIRVRLTTDDAEVRRRARRTGGGITTGTGHAPGEIKEIEIYGYAAGVGSIESKSQKASQELDELLKK